MQRTMVTRTPIPPGVHGSQQREARARAKQRRKAKARIAGKMTDVREAVTRRNGEAMAGIAKGTEEVVQARMDGGEKIGNGDYRT